MGSLKANEAAADASVASLRGAMGRLRGEQADQTRAAVQADTIQREAASKRAAYDRMSQLALSSNDQAKSEISSAKVIEPAHVLLQPTSPNKPLFIALVVVVALAVGAAVIAVQEMMVTGLRTVEDVQTKIGVPVLAAIPRMPKGAPADILIERPTSLYAEAFRIARASVLGVRSDKGTKVIAITSAVPSEGKTTTALAFARTLAMNGANTLLVECDVRRAAMRHVVGTPPGDIGIVEVLHGEAPYRSAITSGDVPNLEHLLVTSPYFSSEDLFGGGAMQKLLAELRLRYDQIVLDLPPLMGLADGRFLAVAADATVMIVKWNETPSDAVASAADWLRSDGANLIGVVYSMVDTGTATMGGIYYSKKYAGYYQTA